MVKAGSIISLISIILGLYVVNAEFVLLDLGPIFNYGKWISLTAGISLLLWGLWFLLKKKSQPIPPSYPESGIQ